MSNQTQKHPLPETAPAGSRFRNTIGKYTIKRNNETVGYYRQNILCKSRYHELLKYQPLSDHTITAWGYDEEDELWENEPKNLKNFLEKIREKKIIEYFKNKFGD